MKIDAKGINNWSKADDIDSGRIFDFPGHVFVCFSKEYGENKEAGFRF